MSATLLQIDLHFSCYMTIFAGLDQKILYGYVTAGLHGAQDCLLYVLFYFETYHCLLVNTPKFCISRIDETL